MEKFPRAFVDTLWSLVTSTGRILTTHPSTYLKPPGVAFRLCDRQHRSGRGDDVEQNTCLITTPTRKCAEEDYDKHQLLNGSKQHCCSCSCNGTTTDIPTTPRYKNSQLVPQSDENSNPITNPQPPCSYQRSQHDYTYHRCDPSNIPCSHHVGLPGSFGGTPREFLTAATAGSPLGMPVGVVAVERSVWREMESELVQMRTLCHALQVHISTTQVKKVQQFNLFFFTTFFYPSRFFLPISCLFDYSIGTFQSR